MAQDIPYRKRPAVIWSPFLTLISGYKTMLNKNSVLSTYPLLILI
jgi:hypothetical protein